MSKLAIPAAWPDKVWGKNLSTLKKAFAPGSKNMVLLADAAVQALLHAYNHGDPGRCEALYIAVGESAGAIRGESMKEWFRQMSGNQITAAKNKDNVRVWKMVKGWSAEKFRMDDALSVPFWKFMGEEKVNFVTGLSLLAAIKATIKRAEKANEKGEFKGDFSKVKSVLDSIGSFADAKFKPLSKVEMEGEDEPVTPAPAVIPTTETVAARPTIQ